MILEKIQSFCSIPLTVVWHENRSTYFSARKERGRLHLRLHRLFLEAPTPVLEALAKMAVKNDPAARRVVRAMAHLYFSQNEIAPEPLPTQGATYDLQAIYDAVKARYFSADFQASIGWSRASKAKRFRSITFGSYDRHSRQIRINRLLDQPLVPSYFVEFIVYHEMLHGVCLSRIDSDGRCSIHTPEFRAREKQFHAYELAREWQKNSLIILKKGNSRGRS